jgi:hemerythrin-like metal-binding protein
MAQLQWADELALDQPQMDQTHREFVALLGQVGEASDHALLPLWRELLAHTEAHFAQEDAWMAATRFGAVDCHSSQHGLVLQVMREAGAAVVKNSAQLPMLRDLARELGKWFAQHAQTMDAALAQHMLRVGFDPVSGVVGLPEQLPQGAGHDCDAASC